MATEVKAVAVGGTFDGIDDVGEETFEVEEEEDEDGTGAVKARAAVAKDGDDVEEVALAKEDVEGEGADVADIEEKEGEEMSLDKAEEEKDTSFAEEAADEEDAGPVEVEEEGWA